MDNNYTYCCPFNKHILKINMLEINIKLTSQIFQNHIIFQHKTAQLYY